jgi:hypothetical protein
MNTGAFYWWRALFRGGGGLEVNGEPAEGLSRGLEFAISKPTACHKLRKQAEGLHDCFAIARNEGRSHEPISSQLFKLRIAAV